MKKTYIVKNITLNYITLSKELGSFDIGIFLEKEKYVCYFNTERNIIMYKNNLGEEIKVYISEHNLLTTDTEAYTKITKIINPFDLNLTKDNPYKDDEKNKSCFLTIETNEDNILVVFKTEEYPKIENIYEMYYDYNEDNYPDLVKEGIINFDLINDKNELVLMFGTSIIILNINTLEVIKYITSNKIKNYGIKLSYENNKYIVKDETENLTYFDKNLNVIE